MSEIKNRIDFKTDEDFHKYLLETGNIDDGIGYFEELKDEHIPNYLNEIKNGKSTPKGIANALFRDFGIYWERRAIKLIYEDWNNWIWKHYKQEEMIELLERTIASITKEVDWEKVYKDLGEAFEKKWVELNENSIYLWGKNRGLSGDQCDELCEMVLVDTNE